MKTQLFARVPNGTAIDHDNIGPWECKSFQCECTCCTRPQEYTAEAVRQIRDTARTARTINGKTGFHNYLRTLIVRKTDRAPKSNPFSGRKRITPDQGYVLGGCRYCNTIEGHLDRNHTFRKCPRKLEGEMAAENAAMTQHHYYMPPLANGMARRRVSRSFFQSVFRLGQKHMKKLRVATEVVDLLTDGTGRHGAHASSLTLEVKTLVLDTVLKFVSAAEDHYEKMDRVASRWLTLGEGVPWADVWWDFISTFHPECAQQCLRLKYKPGIDLQKDRPSDAAYRNDEAGSYLQPMVSYDALRKWVRSNYKVRTKALSVDQCPECAKWLDRMRREKIPASQDYAKEHFTVFYCLKRRTERRRSNRLVATTLNLSQHTHTVHNCADPLPSKTILSILSKKCTLRMLGGNAWLKTFPSTFLARVQHLVGMRTG